MVTLTEEQKKSPLYKYYQIPIDPVPEETREKIMAMSFDDGEGENLADLNDMFNDGYSHCEFGLFKNPDGGCLMSNLTQMPGVTADMFDWWFAWHGLDTYRYLLWDKEDHFYVQTQNVEQALDDSLSYRERFWNTEHILEEQVMPDMPPARTHLHFVHPTVVGFDADKFAAFKGTIVCTPGPAVMVHFLRPVEGGSELRTRFFMGYEPGKKPYIPDFPFFEEANKWMLMHNVKEFTHLAKILPELYNEFKDDFRVGLE